MQQKQLKKKSGYETTVIFKPDITEENLKNIKDRIQQVIQKFEGQLVLQEDWGRKKLAYSIQKESRGIYYYYVYTGMEDIVHEMERHLRLNDQVLRFLTVSLGVEFDTSRFCQRRAELQALAKRREEEREARREERNAERRAHLEDRSEYYPQQDNEVFESSGIE